MCAPMGRLPMALGVLTLHIQVITGSDSDLLDHSSSSSSGSGSSSSSELWHCDADTCYENEYDYVESWIMLAIMLLALVFEAAKDRFERAVDDTYFYGKLQKEPQQGHADSVPEQSEHNDIYRVPLFKHLFLRFTGELMVLGWIAFLVFALREASLFYLLVDWFPADGASIHIPVTAYDWLHMVELVHMKLFLGMVIYFALVSRIVSGSIAKIQEWEEMRILRNEVQEGKQKKDFKSSMRSTMSAWGTSVGTASFSDGQASAAGWENTKMRRYIRWRSYLISHVMSWEEKRPEAYLELKRRMGLDPDDDDVGVLDVRSELDTSLSFSGYLTFAVYHCVLDTVSIHPVTWGVVIMLFALFAFSHIFFKLRFLFHITPAFMLAVVVLLACLKLVVQRCVTRVESNGHTTTLALSDSDEVGAESRFHEKHQTELWVLRALQVILFVLSCSAARTLGDPVDWSVHPRTNLVACCAFLLLFFLLAWLLPSLVPMFTVVMALPPYMDQQNIDFLYQVLDKHYRYHGVQQTKAPEENEEEAMAKRRQFAGSGVFSTPLSPIGRPRKTQERARGSVLNPDRLESTLAQLLQQQQDLTNEVRAMRAALHDPFGQPPQPEAARTAQGSDDATHDNSGWRFSPLPQAAKPVSGRAGMGNLAGPASPPPVLPVIDLPASQVLTPEQG